MRIGEMSVRRNEAAGVPRHDQALVTAEEWFAGGQRIPYHPGTARVLTAEQATATPGALRVFERVTAGPGPDRTWLTLLPGFPDGSYGWAQVDRLLGGDLGPRLYVEPVGQGESDSPGTTRTPSSAPTWSRRCGGTTTCAAPSWSHSITPRWRCSNCSAASWNSPPHAMQAGR
jgi:hypothetical protein